MYIQRKAEPSYLGTGSKSQAVSEDLQHAAVTKPFSAKQPFSRVCFTGNKLMFRNTAMPL